MLETDRLCHIITENVKVLWSPEDLENKNFSESGLLSSKVFFNIDTENINSRYSELRKALLITKSHLADLNKTDCKLLDIDIRVRLVSFSCAYELFVKKLSSELVDREPDWELYNQICLILSVFYALSNYLSVEVTYDLIKVCRQNDLFLI